MVNTQPAVLVRVARVQDLPAVADLWEELMDYHLRLDARYERSTGSREVFLRHLKSTAMRSPDHMLWIAESERAIAGFLAARVEYGGAVFAHPDFGYITDACVSPSYRRLGVGRRLFAEARAWFETRHLKSIRVSVSTDNPAAMAFWREVGFRPFMERLWYDLG
ncbi:MAG TPA: GNAT family N-acetyltransferase [Armatimonadota bacterium]|jgi:ribosomal protein S18 acetylase RimI-like enzyme